ncbi:hypothetical protein GCM10020331_074660 [Ectobacillus funiculus]
MNVYEGVMIKGDRVSTIPMLIADEIIDYKIGDKIKIEGIIEFRRIITPSGKLSFFSPAYYYSIFPLSIKLPVRPR